ncbi:MAG: hypothetical protein E7607_08540 [Ruminococcaceae bacterium]|nr:hypothetical protein [Oscillospiraceae bacterium]
MGSHTPPEDRQARLSGAGRGYSRVGEIPEILKERGTPHLLRKAQKWVRIPRPKIDKLACQAQGEGILAQARFPLRCVKISTYAFDIFSILLDFLMIL